MLHLTYWWLHILLHRPFLGPGGLTPIPAPDDADKKNDHIEVYSLFSASLTLLIELAYQMCWRAAENIMELLSTWRAAYTLRYVPLTIIQIVFAAGTVYLLWSPQSPTNLSETITSSELIVQYLNEIGESWHYANNLAVLMRKLMDEGLPTHTTTFIPHLSSNIPLLVPTFFPNVCI
jgi:hypothetical protein